MSLLGVKRTFIQGHYLFRALLLSRSNISCWMAVAAPAGDGLRHHLM